jgi:uncharacterized protein
MTRSNATRTRPNLLAMPAILALPALLALPAISVIPAAPATGAMATQLAAQAARQDALVLLMADDTFAVENITRTAAGLEAELTGRATGRMVYSVVYGPGGTVRELTLRAWMPGRADDDAPMQEARVTMEGDSAIVEITGSAGAATQRLATRPGAFPYLNPSFALLEPVLARTRALGAETATVPLFFLQGGQTLDATVTWATPDSATITIAGSIMHAVVDTDGAIRRASVPAQHLVVTRVAGVHLPPAGMEPPDYSAPADASYTAEAVTVPTPAGHTLAGTLTRPPTMSPVPAVVMITGSGSQDRDQALPTLPGYRPFREIADALARNGIAVLRMDDQGFGESTGDAASATSADLADDIRAGLDYLRTRPDIDPRRLALVGHSEGGLIAPMIAATDTSLAGIVLIAGPSRTGREIIAFQQRQAIEGSAGIPEAARDSAFQAAQVQIQEMAERSPWIRFFLDHEPLATARHVRHTPVLVLHGATDRQVTVDQAEELAAAFTAAGNPDVTVRIFPDVNHLLLRDPDGDPADYARLERRTVAPQVLDALADWLIERLR